MKKVIFTLLLLVLFTPIVVNASISEKGTILRTFNNEHNEEALEESVILEDGSFIVTGYYYAAANGRTDLGTSSDYKGIIMRYDKNGNLLWEKSLDNNARIFDIALTPDEDVVVVGQRAIIKLDKNGEIIKSVIDDSIYLQDVAVDEEGNIYASTYTGVVKLNENLEVLGSKPFTDPISIYDVMIYKGYVILYGNNSGSGNDMQYVEKLNKDLSVVWTKDISRGYASSISQIGDNIILGAATSTSLIDENGNLIWEEDYFTGTNTTLKAVGATNNNTIMVFGQEEYENENLIQIVILEYSLTGELLDRKIYYETQLEVEKATCTYDDTDCACGGMMTSERGFVLTGYTAKKEPNYDPDLDDSYDGDYYGYIIYNTIAKQYMIHTKTDGNGTIEVVETAEAGDKISFRVQAKTGYKLSGITITTNTGEKVEFTEDNINEESGGVYTVSANSFIMPYSDVTIEARWSLKPTDLINPATGSGKIIILLIVLLPIIYTFIIRKKVFKTN